MDIKDVAFCFFKLFHPDLSPDKDYVKKILKEGEYLLSRGWTPSSITNRLCGHHMSGEDLLVDSLFDIIKKNWQTPYSKEGNLIEKDKFYYHHKLHKTSKPTEANISDEGKLIKKVNPFYLELVEYFNVDELTDYFNYKMKIYDDNLYKMNKGGFNKIVHSYGLDLILFTIDAVYSELHYKDMDLLFNYSQLYSYIKEGERRLSKARNNSSNRVIPFYNAYIRGLLDKE